jgi:hypothetical protein
VPVPVAARSKAWVCGRSLVVIVGSNSAGDMVVVSVVCCQRLVGHTCRGGIPSVVCPLSVIAKPRKGRSRPGLGSNRHRGKKRLFMHCNRPYTSWLFRGILLRQGFVRR